MHTAGLLVAWLCCFIQRKRSEEPLKEENVCFCLTVWEYSSWWQVKHACHRNSKHWSYYILWREAERQTLSFSLCSLGTHPIKWCHLHFGWDILPPLTQSRSSPYRFTWRCISSVIIGPIKFNDQYKPHRKMTTFPQGIFREKVVFLFLLNPWTLINRISGNQVTSWLLNYDHIFSLTCGRPCQHSWKS